ncbi:hypothetical protein [Ferrimonas balearica]|uniref:hypothetical protein n=1 Tax=Ferrimonas balearica TaxID=44012 RepID=UPI001C98F353|nr:hypothetical protein [Ferrimonas balearica]MBY5923113.1 hypothetical protein [Ferrimonas balearica]MBY5997511.1 hypothetical protein [Ferrimonas balearica]
MDTLHASPRRFALYRRWLQGAAGGILALDLLFSFQWGVDQIFGPRPLAPIRNWIHECPIDVGLSGWMATIILLGLFSLHGYLALTEPQDKPPLNERHGFGRKPPIRWERFYHQVQVVSGVLLLPLAVLLCYTLVQSPPNPEFNDWSQRLTSLGSRLLYVMLVPVLILHALLGLGRLIVRWWPRNPESLFARRWRLGVSSYLLVFVIAWVVTALRGVPGFAL